jgi:3-hydroxyacyl-[acyl-carrier protein] dehydratase / trans-2-decenoyl-[acyl-carrier protein] isomerase
MRYLEFLDCCKFTKEELLAFSHGTLVSDPPAGGLAKLPTPPFLMFDRITEILRESRKGKIVAEQDVKVDAWYFQCHFAGDPVQPGCLGVDALWQLLGFFCAVSGALGSGRALGAGCIEFTGQVRPHDSTVRYELDIRRFTLLKESGAAIAIADGRTYVDDEQIYDVKDAKVGIFKGIAYDDYPNPKSKFARGGLMDRGIQNP